MTSDNKSVVSDFQNIEITGEIFIVIIAVIISDDNAANVRRLTSFSLYVVANLFENGGTIRKGNARYIRGYGITIVATSLSVKTRCVFSYVACDDVVRR